MRLAVLLLCTPLAVLAHEGHHHDDDEQAPAAAIQAPVSPPAAGVPQVELVAQREGGDIVLYADDYATNAPLSGLQLSVHSGTRTLEAAASGEGAYRIPADLVDATATRAIEVEVHGAGIDLRQQLELPPPLPAAAATAAASLHLPAWAYAAASAVPLFVAAWLLRRRRVGRTTRELGAA